MEGKVADVSVLAAMLFGEPRRDEAASLLRESDLYEPLLVAYELASITRKKMLRYPDERARLLEALRVGLSMEMTWVAVDHQQVVGLALETGLTTYDASYLQLSRRLGVPLVTFDQELQRAIQPDSAKQ